ncbi:MAG: anaerobic ribonucleoside-triphosphate reductase [Candidatus Bathyarchaeia archaeon]
MPRRTRRESSDVFDAASAPIRMEALKLLNLNGPTAYSDLMATLGLEPAKDAGKFVYHLRTLRKAGLIDVEPQTRKYVITELGSMMVSFAQTLNEYALKKEGKLLVRTSRYAIEEFDRDRITDVLIQEAGMPPDLADKISAEAEERLLRLQTKYLTAPLIREFVNAILIEKDLEEYRHKLTRLGMPVNDVTRIFEKASQSTQNAEYIDSTASGQVLTEYMLLDALPRDIADAHLSGRIHLCNSASWVLRPHAVYHALGHFLQSGLNRLNTSLIHPPTGPPQSFFSALLMTLALTETFSSEVSGDQTLDYFNVFLAPYVRGKSDEEIKEALVNFLAMLGLRMKTVGSTVALGLETVIPDHLKNLKTIRPGGTPIGSNENYAAESIRLLSLILDAASELSEKRTLLAPTLLLKVRRDALKEKYQDVMLQAHELALKGSALFISNQAREWQEISSYNSLGERVESDWTDDWEVDTVRTGCLDDAVINLPRIAYESKGNDDRFFENITKTVDLAAKALGIKQAVIEKRMKQNLLPNLSQKIHGESYFRLSTSPHTISFVGLNEAVKAHADRQIHEDIIAENFAIRVMEYLNSLVNSTSKELSVRISLSQAAEVGASHHLAFRDQELFGRSVVVAQGDKKRPYYSSVPLLASDPAVTLEKRLKLEERFHFLTRGGHLLPLDVNPESTAQDLLNHTKEICTHYDIGLFGYSAPLAYCSHCERMISDLEQKCPTCGSTSIMRYSREGGRLLPRLWLHP